MVNPTPSKIAEEEPQFFTVANIQDAFDLLSRGFEVYSQASGGRPKSTVVEPLVIPLSSNGTANSITTPKNGNLKRSGYQPDLDIFETADAILVEISLPGVSKSEINIEHESKGNQILVSGEVKRSHLDTPDVKAIKIGRPVGHFKRVVNLDDRSILSEQIEAALKDGVLYLTIPKNKAAETKRKIAVL